MKKQITVPQSLLNEWNACIDRGMAFLDDYFDGPEWVGRIDLDRLDLNDASVCVCGQLFDEQGQKMVVTGYDYALKHVIEHDTNETGRVPDTEMFPEEYLGFSLVEDGDYDPDEIIAGHNRLNSLHELFDLGGSAWVLFTELWAERLAKRQAELGLMSQV